LAKNRNTFEKHRRELEKKRNAEEKRSKRRNRQIAPSVPVATTERPADADDEAPATED
jgi:hypothetical protein